MIAVTLTMASPQPGLTMHKPKPTAAPRNLAVDAYRGLVMLLMLAEALRIPAVARSFPESGFWRFLAFHTSHVEWVGLSLHDLIQPSFSFLVGVALPYSLAGRLAERQPFSRLFAHALWRSLLLVALGIFLRSTHSARTNFTFEDTLTQIGLGYPLLFLLGFRSNVAIWATFALLLFGYWAAWALYPLPPADYDWARVGVPPEWRHHASGFAAHWNKNAHLGLAFDQWFLNLFPRPEPFVANRGGYGTLSFVPTLGTMLLGLLAGRWLREAAPLRERLRVLAIAGVAGIAFGLVLHAAGVCPMVKRIWTPTWTLVSGGCCLLLLAASGWLLRHASEAPAWAFPLLVIGRNSIAAYVLAHLAEGFVADSFRIHLGPQAFRVFGSALEPLVSGAAVLGVLFAVLLWMHRRRLYLRV